MSTVPFRIRRAAVAGTAALALAAALVPGSSQAQDLSEPATIAKGLVAPLSVAVSDDDVLYYSANFAGQLYRKAPGKKPRLVHSSGGKEVGALSTKGRSVYFVEGSALKRRTRSGDIRFIASLGKHEATKNPDSGVTYGIVDPPTECADAWPTDQIGPVSYQGIVEAHPYATAVAGEAVYVADAAANAILEVARGKVRTVAVLPPTGLLITEQVAQGAGIPESCVGETYRFEPVPTDVEVGPGGKLYVSGLPGGPEGPQGAPGSVFTVDPATGKVKRIATGLTSATGLAVNQKGVVWVTELFAGEISRVVDGRARVVAELPLPAAIELHEGDFFGTINVLPGDGQPPNGKVVRFR